MNTFMKRRPLRGEAEIVCSLIIVLLLAVAATLPGVADAAEIKDLDAPVSEGSKITYKMLVNSVFKGVRKDKETGDLVTAEDKTLRRLGEKERTVVPEGTSLSMFKAIRVRGDGRTYIVMFWNADESDRDRAPPFLRSSPREVQSPRTWRT